MHGVQGFDEVPTEERLRKALCEKADGPGKLKAFLEELIHIFCLNTGFFLGTFGYEALMELALDRVEGEERPILAEELDRVFPERRGKWSVD